MTMDKSIVDRLSDLNKEITNAKNEIQRIEKALIKYPNLVFGKMYGVHSTYYSSDVNPICDHFRTTSSCRCGSCFDNPVRFEAFIEDPEVGRIYGFPKEIIIGEDGRYYPWDIEKNYHSEILDEDWKEKLRKHNYSEFIIDQVQKCFEEKEKERLQDRKEDEENKNEFP